MSNFKDDLSLESFKEINKPNFFGEVEYIYSIFKLKKLPLDLLRVILNLFSPQFRIINGFVFLHGEFNEKKFSDLSERNLPFKEIQFWMNLIEITSLHEDINTEDAILFAENIVKFWNIKLMSDSIYNGAGRARFFQDKDYGEVFITID